MPRSQQPAHTAIAETLRTRIAAGEWPPGTRLPSRAALATELGVGGHLVQRAQESLIHEGLLEGRTGSGTYAAHPRPRLLLHLDPGSQFGVRSATTGYWTILCRRPGPAPFAYFTNDQPTLLAHPAQPSRPGTPTVLRAATAEPDDALLLGLLRGEPVTQIESTSSDGETSLVIVPARLWDITTT